MYRIMIPAERMIYEYLSFEQARDLYMTSALQHGYGRALIERMD